MLVLAPLPGSLSGGSSLRGLYSPSGVRYNYAVGGLPFLSYASREHPIVRETAPVRKDQFDSANTPGEHSLEGWWLRSQSSFHSGAGLLFADVTGDDTSVGVTRFRSSRNVNVWTQGRAFLLNAAKKIAGSPITDLVDAVEFVYGDGTNATLAVGGTNTRVIKTSGVTTAAFGGSAKNLASVTTDGSYMYVSTADGVFSAPIPASAATAFTWTKEYTVPGAPDKSTHLAYVKQRLMLGVGPSIYELPPHPAGAPAALPTAKYTSVDSAWVWTGFSESSAAIYAVGNAAGVRGAVLKFKLASDGTVPTLSGGAIAAQLPFGEVPWSLCGYLGSFVAIGTNKGVRVAEADGDGNLTYGPLLFSTSGPVKAWAARNRFLWCTVTAGIDSDSGLYRIDLSEQVSELRFAYATDLNFAGDAGSCTVVACLGSSDVLMYATANDVYIEDTTSLAATGYLQTARIRYGTLEPKLFKLVKVRGPSLTGPLAFTVLDGGDHSGGSYTYGTGTEPGSDDITIASPTDPQDFVSLKFTLTRDVSTLTSGGEFTGYQLKALPATPRQRIIQLPLLCFDFETDNKGTRVGYLGSAMDRLFALENLERTGNSVVLQDFDASINTECVIEQVRFTQTAAPPHVGGYGGVVTLTLRTI